VSRRARTGLGERWCTASPRTVRRRPDGAVQNDEAGARRAAVGDRGGPSDGFRGAGPGGRAVRVGAGIRWVRQ